MMTQIYVKQTKVARELWKVVAEPGRVADKPEDVAAEHEKVGTKPRKLAYEPGKVDANEPGSHHRIEESRCKAVHIRNRTGKV